MNLRLCFLLLCFCWVLPAGVVTGQPCDSTFRLMSFNIRYDTPADGPNGWLQRKDRIAACVLFHGSSLCGFQEALRSQIEDLEKLLPEYGWCGVGREDGKEAGEFAPIFYRKDRFRLLASGTFWLSPTPSEPGSRGWDAALPRIVTWARLEDIRTSVSFCLFNTHFDHQGWLARYLSARLLLDSVSRYVGTLPVLITGDFNSTDTSRAYGILTGGGKGILRDAFHCSESGHYGPLSSWNGFREIDPGQRIDFIFVSRGVRVLRHGILTDRWDGRFSSDHLPVIADVQARD